MSTSGTTTFNETRDTIISNALQLLNVLASGETANANDITFCASVLNAMIKAWMGQGIHLWTEEEGTIYLVQGQAQYTLQSGISGANASDGSGTPVETTLSSIGSGSSINVTSSTGMTVGDNIGIEISTASMFWTTITSISATTIGLNASLSGTAAVGNLVATYTTQLARPLSIQTARVRDLNGFDRPIWIKPRQDYMMIPQKSITGAPVILYYTPQITNGVCYVWPAPSDVSQRVKITYLRTIQDFDNSSDNPDFPQEWLEAITYNLATRIAPAYGINLSTGGITGNPDLVRMATQFLDDLKAWDTEQPYIQIVRNYRTNR